MVHDGAQGRHDVHAVRMTIAATALGACYAVTAVFAATMMVGMGVAAATAAICGSIRAS
jgi:hypothetical protein